MYLFSISGPFTVMKFILSSFAEAYAKKVFPHPGGPYNNTPWEIFIGKFLKINSYFYGISNVSTIVSI